MKRMLLIGLSLLILTGCEKLNDAQKSGLSLAALSAKERASAFDVIKDRIAPAKAEDALPLKNFLAAHARGLNAQAAGLANLMDAVKAGSVISDSARKMLVEEAKTAHSRARNFELTVPDMAADADLAEFFRSHTAALKSQAETMSQLSALLPPKPPKPVKPAAEK